jgi:hypothetical protein
MLDREYVNVTSCAQIVVVVILYLTGGMKHRKVTVTKGFTVLLQEPLVQALMSVRMPSYVRACSEAATVTVVENSA